MKCYQITYVVRRRLKVLCLLANPSTIHSLQCWPVTRFRTSCVNTKWPLQKALQRTIDLNVPFTTDWTLTNLRHWSWSVGSNLRLGILFQECALRKTMNFLLKSVISRKKTSTIWVHCLSNKGIREGITTPKINVNKKQQCRKAAAFDSIKNFENHFSSRQCGNRKIYQFSPKFELEKRYSQKRFWDCVFLLRIILPAL